MNVLEEDPRWHVLHRSGNYADAVPAAWLNWLPLSGPDGGYPLCVSIRLRGTDIAYTVFVSPMADAAQRTTIVTALRDHSPEFGFKRSKANQAEETWNRVTGVDTLFESGDEDELEAEAILASVVVLSNVSSTSSSGRIFACQVDHPYGGVSIEQTRHPVRAFE